MKILEIGNYPPPMCGWAIQIKFLTEELRRRGHVCKVLNINENRRKKSPEYLDVQNGFDYLYKLLRFAVAGYRFHMHVNAMSPKGYLLALAAVLVGRLVGRPALLTFHGGLPQTYFPRFDSRPFWWAFQLLFRLAGGLSCDSVEIKQVVERYGIKGEKVDAIPCFSVECLDFQPAHLTEKTEAFLTTHHPVFFCYVSYRPEYRLTVLREAMGQFRRRYAEAGFIWLGFPEKELPAAEAFVRTWSAEESKNVFLLGNLLHDQFLTLLTRCLACIRTPACDGVSASVLESLFFGVPVIASENGCRPPGIVTYQELDAVDLCRKLFHVVEHYSAVKAQTRLEGAESNIRRTADWLLSGSGPAADQELVRAS